MTGAHTMPFRPHGSSMPIIVIKDENPLDSDAELFPFEMTEMESTTIVSSLISVWYVGGCQPSPWKSYMIWFSKENLMHGPYHVHYVHLYG